MVANWSETHVLIFRQYETVENINIPMLSEILRLLWPTPSFLLQERSLKNANFSGFLRWLL